MTTHESNVKGIMTLLKGRLTRALSTGDPQTIIDTTAEAFRTFDTFPHGWPDSWHRWNIASQDAHAALARSNW